MLATCEVRGPPRTNLDYMRDSEWFLWLRSAQSAEVRREVSHRRLGPNRAAGFVRSAHCEASANSFGSRGKKQWWVRLNEGDNAGEMSPGSSTDSYPPFAHIWLRENPGKPLTRSIFYGPLENELRKRQVKCFVWSVILYVAETWRLHQSEEKRLGTFEMWICRKMKHVKWTNRIRNTTMLEELDEERIMLKLIKKKKGIGWGALPERLDLHSLSDCSDVKKEIFVLFCFPCCSQGASRNVQFFSTIRISRHTPVGNSWVIDIAEMVESNFPGYEPGYLEYRISMTSFSLSQKRAKKAQLPDLTERRTEAGMRRRQTDDSTVRKYDSILKAFSSLENAYIFLERTILTNSVLLTRPRLYVVNGWKLTSRRGGSEVHSKTQKLLSSSLLPKNLKVRIYKTVILPVVLYGSETWTLTLREEHKLRVFENKMLRKIFGAERDEVTAEWRKLHNTDLHALYSSPDIIRNIKSRRLRWVGHVARMSKSRNVYRVLVGRPEGKRPLGRRRRRWEDNIKMDLREVGYDDRGWINLAEDRDQWRAYVRAAMNLRDP
ncbi:hypothetical protein ANN_09795 [Periplaneta americana]|uniref:Uncharacterized protein n=1 Tax=Periplaneta americana TaxID=6978 RepID=A0ABQ8TP19_PERAM|nr:hypothetical protein ANN_09795 [Periplaneta americana]